MVALGMKSEKDILQIGLTRQGNPFIHLFKKYLLSPNYMPEMILGYEEMKVNKKSKSFPPGKGALLGALLQKFWPIRFRG